MKKNKVIKLRIPGIKVLQDIRDEIKRHKEVIECPYWDEIVALNDYIVPFQDSLIDRCNLCKALFPKIAILYSCPCHVYSPRYLIKRLNQIIDYNLSLYEDGEPRWCLRKF